MTISSQINITNIDNNHNKPVFDLSKYTDYKLYLKKKDYDKFIELIKKGKKNLSKEEFVS